MSFPLHLGVHTARLLTHSRPLVLAVCLLCLPLRRSAAEEHVDLTMGYYLEDHHRVEVFSPALLWETDVSPNTVLRFQGIYDVVSGASPTGAPRTRHTREVTKEVLITTPGTPIVTGFNTVSGPSGGGTKSTPIIGVSGPTVTKVLQTEIVPYGRPFLPLQEFEDQRLGLNLELERRTGDWLWTGGVAYGFESDYESLAGTVKVGRELYHKTTLLTLGASLGQDSVLDSSINDWQTKDTLEGLLSLTQVINAKTLLTLSGTLGTASGFLDDQYKFASVDNVIVHEQRPDVRDRRIVHMLLNHSFDSLNGSLEGMYRFYNDSYNINAQTFGLAWFQRWGRHLILSPSIRYYEQTAADFYDTRFVGAPKIFSADYRLSKLASITAGMKVVWKFNDKLQFTLAYDRYSMWGRDGKTDAENFPKANIVTAGFKLWF
jgi:hypothetical protein